MMLTSKAARFTGRRRFLLALGAGGVLVGSRAFGGAAAQSKPSGGPLRFVSVYTPHGRAHELWEPRDGF